VSSNYESVPLAPGPPGVWRTTGVVLKHDCRLKQRDSILMQVGELKTIVLSPMWFRGKAPAGALYHKIKHLTPDNN